MAKMTAEKRKNIILGSCGAAIVVDTLFAKWLMPERGFFDLLLCGIFAHIVVVVIVAWLMDAVLPQAESETMRHEAEGQTEDSGDNDNYDGITSGDDEENDGSDDDFERWLAEEEERKRIARQEKSSHKSILRCVFSMMAKVAKADGKVVREEVEAAQAVFGTLEFAEAFHEFCVSVFNKARDNRQSVYWYARRFAELVKDIDARVLVYEFLWDVACADGVLVAEEKEILKVVCGYLGISYKNYEQNYARRIASGGVDDAEVVKNQKHEMTLAEAYELMGCNDEVTDSAVRSAFRKAAKKYHPDVLRSAGIPEDLIEVANNKMVELNEAWALICAERGL